jgi:hypothetical protein
VSLSPSTARRFSARLASGPDAPRRARAILRDYLAGRVTEQDLVDVDILVTEMVSEALRLRDGDVARDIGVDAGLVNERLWLSVVDRCVGEPVSAPDALSRVVVEGIAASSGVADGGAARRLWATVAVGALP